MRDLDLSLIYVFRQRCDLNDSHEGGQARVEAPRGISRHQAVVRSNLGLGENPGSAMVSIRRVMCISKAARGLQDMKRQTSGHVTSD